MTKEEFRAIRERYGWTQAHLATLLGCSTIAVNRWENGVRSISGPVALAMRLLDLLPLARDIAHEQRKK